MHPSLDIGYNNPSKQQDSIYSEGSYMQTAPGVNDSMMFDSNLSHMQNHMQLVNQDSFSLMTQHKYLFPSENITNRDWFIELQKPLNITVADIKRDFTNFVKDFPVDIIPHTSDQELQERNIKHRHAMMAAIRKNPKLPNRRLGADLADI